MRAYWLQFYKIFSRAYHLNYFYQIAFSYCQKMEIEETERTCLFYFLLKVEIYFKIILKFTSKLFQGHVYLCFFVSSTTRFCLFCIYSCLGTLTKHNLSYSFVFLQNEEFLFIVLEIDSQFLISVFNRAVHLIEFNHILCLPSFSPSEGALSITLQQMLHPKCQYLSLVFFFFYCSDDDTCCTEVMWNGPIIP